MLDTLQLKHCYTSPLRDDELRERGAIPILSRRNRIFALNPAHEPTLPRLTFIFTPDGIMHLSAECSIPKMLFGYNSLLPTEYETIKALSMISKYIKAATGLDFDASNANVSRVHFANDKQVGEPVAYAAIARLSRVKIRGLEKLVYDDTTVYFKNQSREIRIYPKLQEVYAKGKATLEAIKAARGILRFEYCLLNKYGIDSHVKKHGLANSRAESLITMSVSDSILSTLFNEIDFPGLITNEKSNLEILMERFSTRKAIRLTGFLELVYRYGVNCYKDISLEVKKASYYRDMNDCRKAGVWNSSGIPE